MSQLILNPQQIAIRDWVNTGSGSANVEARAGTGKTSTLVVVANEIKSGNALFCAFNKSIALELGARIQSRYCRSATLHSVGLALFKKIRSSFELESRKVRYIVREIVPQGEKKVLDAVTDAVRMAKQNGFGLPGMPHWESSEAWDSLLDDYDLYDEIPDDFSHERTIEACQKAYAKSVQLCEDRDAIIDFDDMILAPLMMGGGGSWMSTYDWVMVDEAQDLSMVRYTLADRVLRKGGRFVAVGDSRQAIYGFAGAKSDAMESIRAARNSIVLPLSITYRCPSLVVQIANQWVPDYKAADGAPEGVVRRIPVKEFLEETDLNYTDVILCRNTRPLLGIANYIRKHRGMDCVVEGFSPRSLIAMAERFGDVTISAFVTDLRNWATVEVDRLIAKGKDEKAESLREKVSTLLEICDDLADDDSIRRLVSKIERLFGRDKSDEEYGEKKEQTVLTLCTIHRAKGREWNRVWLVGRNRYQPSKYAKTKEALQQEENLEYVAVTRTKHELVEVLVPQPRKGADGELVEWWEDEFERSKAIVVSGKTKSE